MIKNISEEIPIDNCFSDNKHSSQIYSKKQLNENPEPNISSKNVVDFKMEPTIETITKRKHDVYLMLQRLKTIQIIVIVIPAQAVKKRIKIRIITRIKRMKNHRRNGNGNEKRKKRRRIKTPATEKENQTYL